MDGQEVKSVISRGQNGWLWSQAQAQAQAQAQCLKITLLGAPIPYPVQQTLLLFPRRPSRPLRSSVGPQLAGEELLLRTSQQTVQGGLHIYITRAKP